LFVGLRSGIAHSTDVSHIPLNVGRFSEPTLSVLFGLFRVSVEPNIILYSYARAFTATKCIRVGKIV